MTSIFRHITSFLQALLAPLRAARSCGNAALLLVPLCIASALLCSCADMHEPEASLSETDNAPAGDTFLTISLRYDSGTAPSRAGTTDGDGKVVNGSGDPADIYPDDDPYAVGTDAENTIHSIHIFIGNLNSLPAEGSRPENADGLVVSQTVTGVGDDCKYRVFNFNISGGHLFKPDNGDYQLTTVLDDVKNYPNKVIYVATNLTTAQWQHICKNGVNAAYNFPVRTMAIVDDITKSNGFAMFCTKPCYVTLTAGTTVELAPPFNMRRIMAKMHLVIKADPNNANHALVKTYKYKVEGTGVDKIQDDRPTFQVRIEDVHYTANALNTSTYLFQQFHANGNGNNNAVLDPNWDEFRAESEFVYHPINAWNNYLDAFNVQTPEVYDPDRIPTGSNDATCYSAGIYVPENTISPAIATVAEPVRDNNISDAEYNAALSAYNTYVNNYTTNTTHMIVRAFVTPLLLKVNVGLVNYMQDEGSTVISAQMKATWEAATGKDWATEATDPNEIFEFYCENKTISDYITDYSLRYENYSGLDKLAFFARRETTTVGSDTYESTKFYCYSAAKIVAMTEAHESDDSNPEYSKGDNNSVKFEGFTLFTDGYAHYQVFLNDNLGPNVGDHVTSPTTQTASADNWKESQIIRNTYYILVVDAFSGVAGGIDPTKEFIQVHTETIPYVQSWTANRDLTEDDHEADYPNDDEP